MIELQRERERELVESWPHDKMEPSSQGRDEIVKNLAY